METAEKSCNTFYRGGEKMAKPNNNAMSDFLVMVLCQEKEPVKLKYYYYLI